MSASVARDGEGGAVLKPMILTAYVFYANYLKIYAVNAESLKLLPNIFKEYTNKIEIKFRLDKCTKMHLE